MDFNVTKQVGEVLKTILGKDMPEVSTGSVSGSY
jgi:hypothetical protein